MGGGVGGKVPSAEISTFKRLWSGKRVWPLKIRKKAGVAQVREGQAGAAPQRPSAWSLPALEGVHPRGLRDMLNDPRKCPRPRHPGS